MPNTKLNDIFQSIGYKIAKRKLSNIILSASFLIFLAQNRYNMNSLYPLKFEPILKDRIWGGNRISTELNKPQGALPNIGESWELSGVEGDVSVVSNGFLQGNAIDELIEVYMGDLVGDKVFAKFGTEFPLLFKFIDANDYLSIQVHPDDELAMQRHNMRGKTEMWYIIDAAADARLISGFNCPMDKQKYLENFRGGTLRNIVNWEQVKAGDVFFIPAGRIHAIGPNIMLAEIQETSDITYRIYDWDRLGADGKPRAMHTDLAIDAIDYTFQKNYKTQYEVRKNLSSPIVSCQHFTTNLLNFDKPIEIDYGRIDSFVVYMAIDGKSAIYTSNQEQPTIINKGETVLIPAELKEVELKPIDGEAKLLEVYV